MYYANQRSSFSGLGADAADATVPCAEDAYNQVINGEISVEDEKGRKVLCRSMAACTAAAVCTAYGGSAVAAMCAEIGGYIGEVLADVFEEVGDFVGGVFGGAHDADRMQTVRKAHLKATLKNLKDAQQAIQAQWQASLGRTHTLYEALFGQSMTVEATMALYKKHLGLDAIPGTNPVAYNPKYMTLPACYPQKGCISSVSSTKAGKSRYVFLKKGDIISGSAPSIVSGQTAPPQRCGDSNVPYPKYECPNETFSAYFYAIDNAQRMEIYFRAMMRAELRIAIDGAVAAAAIEAHKQVEEAKDAEKAKVMRARRKMIRDRIAKRRAAREKKRRWKTLLSHGTWGLLWNPK